MDSDSASANEQNDAIAWLAGLDSTMARLVPFERAEGEALYVQGNPGESFMILTEGTANVLRDGTLIATVGPGSVVGELALLTGKARTMTIVASGDVVRGLKGNHGDFEALLEHDEIRAHFMSLAARRLAINVHPVPFVTPKGLHGCVRPLLGTDRSDFLDFLDQMSAESRRLRFFSTAKPSPRLIEYLLAVDYVHNFAWVALEDDPHRAAGIGRMIRDDEHHNQAEVAFTILDDLQGKGLGTILFGACGVAASKAGIDTFVAEVLEENIAMRRVFDKAAAKWKRVDRGVVQAMMDVDNVVALLDADLTAALGTSAQGIGLAAATALNLPH